MPEQLEEEAQDQEPVTRGAFEEAGAIARETGAERREAIMQGIYSLLGRVSAGVARSADYALGSPEAAAALGRRGVEAGTDAARRGAEAAGEFGMRTVERVRNTRDNLVERGEAAYERVTGWFRRKKEASVTRVNTVAEQAKNWGVEHVVAPAKAGLDRIYAVPGQVAAFGEKARGQVQEARRHFGEMRADRRQRKADEQLRLQAEALDAERTNLEARARQLAEARDAAEARARELQLQAEETRSKMSTMGRAAQIAASM
jgi:hypothetical protein